MHTNDSLRSQSRGELVNLANKLGINTKHINQSLDALISAILKAQEKALIGYPSCDLIQRGIYSQQARYLIAVITNNLTSFEKSLIQMDGKGEKPIDPIHQTIQFESVKMAKVVRLLDSASQLLENYSTNN